MRNRYPIIDNMEVLEPAVIDMPKGEKSPLKARIFTQREWKFMQKCMNGGVEVEVILKK